MRPRYFRQRRQNAQLLSPLSFTNISGGAARHEKVSPKTWRILAFADAIYGVLHRDYKRIEAASGDESRDKLNKSNGGQI